MKIAVAGLGYVGLSNALMLSQHNEVVAYDVSNERIALLRAGKSPLAETDIAELLASGRCNFRPTSRPEEAYANADVVFIATPTDYDPETNRFNTSSVENSIREALRFSPAACIVIKSTVPVGFTRALRDRLNNHNILFSPEFLREGRALHDSLYPSRIVVGEISSRGQQIADLLAQGAKRPSPPMLLTESNEAEAIKLFANTYLAMRVAYFNELDTYAACHALDARRIIEGICLDPRIGMHYNNPSFGYGGYCLPKDTRQLLANYEGIPQNLIGAIVGANATRKQFVAEQILSKKPKTVGIHRLTMKSGSDNFRSSSIRDIITILAQSGVEVIIYEPNAKGREFDGIEIVNDLTEFKRRADIIVTNRKSTELSEIATERVFSRDIFGAD